MSFVFIPTQPRHLIVPQKASQDQKKEKELPPISIPKTLFTCVNEYFSKMQNIRIIQKNLVYLIGLSKDLAYKDVKIQFIYSI